MTYQTGQTIKGYKILERIGSGGFGAVFRAYQTTLGREVAIKVILPAWPTSLNLSAALKMKPNLSPGWNTCTSSPSTTIGAIRKALTWSCAGCAAAA